MPTKPDFGGRRKPPQLKVIVFLNEEGRFGKIVLSSDMLHDVIREPFLQRAHSCRISAEKTVGKSIDLINGKFHNYCIWY